MRKNDTFKIFLLSIVLLAAGVFFLSGMVGHFEKTKAVISRIETEYNNIDNTYDYHVYVDYVADGTRYRDIPLGSYDAGMTEGKKITIEYNVDKPEKVRTKHSIAAVVVLFAVGGAGLVLSGTGLLAAKRAARRGGAED